MMKARRRSWRRSLVAASSLLVIGLVSGELESGALAQGGAGSAPPAANGVGSNFELVFWQSIMASEDRAQFEAYLTQYPQGTFSALARVKIASLTRPGEAPAPVAPAAPVQAQAAPPAPAATPHPAPAMPSGNLAPFPGLAEVPAPMAPAAPVNALPAPAQAVPGAVIASAQPAPTPATAPVAAPPAMAATVPGAQAAVLTSAAPLPPSAVVAAPAAPATPPSLLTRLAAYSSQGVAAPAIAAAPAVATTPQLAAMPAIELPAQFCSAEQRNQFHQATYMPTVKIADDNNKAAIAYLDQLQATYDARVKDRDINGANAVARDAGAFRPLAEQAYAARSALLGLFDRMMAVPIANCQPAK
jgi:hypothetical protein